MKYRVKCIKHKAETDLFGRQIWSLESGKVYEATKVNDNKIEVVNHYGNAISLTLKEFKMYCEIIKILV